MKLDKELEEFRGAMEVPDTFVDGFNWSSLLGALFIGMIMVPGAMYLGLLAGQGIGPAAQWVTVILFIEVARRAQRDLNQSEIFVLFYMAGAAMGSPFGGLIWHQYFVRSKAAIANGIADDIPTWYAPQPDSSSFADRTFFHWDWLPVIVFVIFQQVFTQLTSMILGYGFFRMASDLEKLPFPMAPIAAQGIKALAEDTGKKDTKEGNWRWRVFSIGGALGLAFGFIYLGLPTLGNALADSPITILPIPFSDWTNRTSSILPAVATGMSWDLGNFIIGMVLPFMAMLGSFIGLLITFVANPFLYKFNILHTWSEGDDTIKTMYYNNIDFYFSFSIGVAIAVALFGFWQVYVNMKHFRKKKIMEDNYKTAMEVPPGRGDIPTWLILLTYFVMTTAYILISGWLIEWHTNVVLILIFFGFVYTPLISYVTARLEGMVGQVVEIPFIREASLILSGYEGVKIWFLPIPANNYGDNEVVFYRKCELLGTSFWSIWKTKLILFPIIILSSIFFANYIWSIADVPSSQYPFANVMWPLQAANACIMYTSTLGEYSLFEEAFNWGFLAWGAGLGVVIFGVLGNLGTPILLMYGVVRGLNQTLPHSVIPQFLGALVGTFYFRKRFGVKWRQYAPVLSAGFACGMGLIGTFGIAITFLSSAIIKVPF